MKRESIEKFLKLTKNYNVFDVRSPGEYEKGHIINAINLPIVSDDERAVVGTLYKQTSKNAAYLKGLEYIGPKLRDFAESAINKSVDNKILLYCWRGGQRSASMAWLFELVGVKPILLDGGYRSYRRLVQEYVQQKLNIIIIGGYTGTGKTDLLYKLEESGEQILDLEGLANHKGSAFGSIGMGKQPHYETFENRIFEKLFKFDLNRPIFIEDESRQVGRLSVPISIFNQMSEASIIVVERSLDNRLDRLEKDYIKVEHEELITYTNKIRRRLGNQRTDEAIESIKNDNMKFAIENVLYYYDKAYQRSIDKRKIEKFLIKSNNDNDIIDKIKKYLQGGSFYGN